MIIWRELRGRFRPEKTLWVIAGVMLLVYTATFITSLKQSGEKRSLHMYSVFILSMRLKVICITSFSLFFQRWTCGDFYRGFIYLSPRPRVAVCLKQLNELTALKGKVIFIAQYHSSHSYQHEELLGKKCLWLRVFESRFWSFQEFNWRVICYH